MILKNTTMNFLDKIDLFLFRKLNENHAPATFKTIKTVFFGGLVTSLLIMIIQMTGLSKDTQEVIISILLLCLLGGAMYLVRDTIKSFNVWWKSTIYCFYLLVLSIITFNIAMWSFMIALALLVIGLIFKIMSPSKKDKVIIRYSDGTEEEGKMEGTGLCGEKYVKDKDGNTHIIP